MNPMAQAATQNEFPSMDEVRKNFEIRWYRCPVDKAILRKLIQPSDAQGLFQALGHLGLWVITGITAYYLCTHEIWWGFFAALFIHGTIGSFFTAPRHELCHKTVFKTKWLNEVFLHLFSLFGWLNFRVYQFSHNYHHRYTLFIEGDREEVLPVKPSLRFLYLLQLFTVNVTGGYQSAGIVPTLKNFIKLALNRFENPFNSWGQELYEGHMEERMKAVRWARIVLGFHTFVIVVSIAIGQPVIAVLVSGSAFIANWHRYFVGVPMHCGLRTQVPDFRKCVRTITLDPFTEFLYWHMNWHLEHHMYAAVPCYNLKKLHQAVAEDMPQTRTLFGAWKEMRETWKRQCVDPKYAYDTPVPTSGVVNRDKEIDPLASSVGELAPRGIAV